MKKNIPVFVINSKTRSNIDEALNKLAHLILDNKKHSEIIRKFGEKENMTLSSKNKGKQKEKAENKRKKK